MRARGRRRSSHGWEEVKRARPGSAKTLLLTFSCLDDSLLVSHPFDGCRKIVIVPIRAQRLSPCWKPGATVFYRIRSFSHFIPSCSFEKSSPPAPNFSAPFYTHILYMLVTNRRIRIGTKGRQESGQRGLSGYMKLHRNTQLFLANVQKT